jgi:aminodeoxyfutalosine deaminase
LAKRGIEWTPPGLSTIQYLKRVGILDCEPLLAHCIRVDQEDIETLRQTGSKVAHCPKSNAKLGHGRAPLAALLDGDVVVGLGSDSVASNNTCDLIEEARFAALFARDFKSFSPSSSQMLAAATAGGAQCLGFGGGIGALSEGSQADLIVVKLDGAHQVPVYDPVTTLLFSSSGRDVVLTIIAGREVYRDRRVTGVDEDRLRARLNEIARKLTGAN